MSLRKKRKDSRAGGNYKRLLWLVYILFSLSVCKMQTRRKQATRFWSRLQRLTQSGAQLGSLRCGSRAARRSSVRAVPPTLTRGRCGTSLRACRRFSFFFFLCILLYLWNVVRRSPAVSVFLRRENEPKIKNKKKKY